MKKPAIICLILILALAVMGMGYSGWSKSVALNQHLTTGLLTLGVRNIGSDDYVEITLPARDKEPEEKTIGFLRCRDGYYKFNIRRDSFYENVRMDFKGFPGYSPSCTVQIANGGTIPARIEDVSILWQGEISDNIRVGRWAVTFPKGNKRDGSGLTSLNKTLKNVIIDPKQKMMVEIQLLCSQDGFAGGEMHVAYRRWNERF